MASNLVIVESPAKAKTIEKFLGKDFIVKSCFGHIRDLIKGDSAIDVDKGYTPKYEVPADKKAVVNELKKLAKKSDVVWLASDEDREGEAISWHLSEVLDLDPGKRKRIVFHEITKPAILKAIENPRDIDEHLVDAQQARRVLDRLVGFELSPVLWKKVKPSLSAGRVQSVAVRLIVERDREIDAFESASSFKVSGIFTSQNTKFKAQANSTFKTEEEAYQFLDSCVSAQFQVSKVDVKPAQKSPAAPFTTSTLQQEASRKLGYGVSRTMMLAQRLYENGHITYMRTDSVNLSEQAINGAKSTITQEYGEQYSHPRTYKTKKAGAQEAHEAIRPTNFNVSKAGDDDGQQRLYQLIWKRAIASQMSNAQLERTQVRLENNKNNTEFVAKGEVIKFDGFLKVYLEGNDDEEEVEDGGILPAMAQGDSIGRVSIQALQRFSRPPARYTEASLVKKLEELGIGRPSTYAPTIATVQKRGYVEKGDHEGTERKYQSLVLSGDQIETETLTERTGSNKNKLVPSDIGKVVTDFLMEHFDQILDYKFTANVEKEFDEIARGLKDWSKMIDTFYNPFHKTVDNALENADRVSGERLLGEHPETGHPVIARVGRYGPMVQIGEAGGEEKPKFASLRKGQSIEKITFEEALELFKLPRMIGQFEDADMKVAIGRFGPYILHQSKFYSLPKDVDPMTVTKDEGVDIILAKRKKDAERMISTFEEDESLSVQNGRWGPFIKFGKKNYKIPKDQDAKSLSYEDCMARINEQDKSKGTKSKAKKKK